MPLILAVGTGKLIAIFGFDDRSLPTTIVTMALSALLLSGILRTLRSAHLSAKTLLMTLPISSAFWPVRDTLLVSTVGVVPLVVALLPVSIHRLASIDTLGGLALSYCALIIALRATLRLGERRSVMFAAILSAGWASAAIAAVIR